MACVTAGGSFGPLLLGADQPASPVWTLLCAVWTPRCAKVALTYEDWCIFTVIYQPPQPRLKCFVRSKLVSAHVFKTHTSEKRLHDGFQALDKYLIYSEARPHQKYGERSQWNRKCAQELNEENIYKLILLRFPPFVSPVGVRQLSASKSWHPNHLENKGVSAFCRCGAQPAASSRLFSRRYCGSRRRVSGLGWSFALRSGSQLSAPVCFALARFTSSRSGPVMLSHSTHSHTVPVFASSLDLFVVFNKQVNRILSVLSGKERNGCLDCWRFTPCCFGLSFSHHHPYHFQTCFCSPLICAQPNMSISHAHVDIRRSLLLCSCLCIGCSLSIIAHAFNQAISGLARWLYTVPPPLLLPWSPLPLEHTAAGETAHWRHAVVEM